MATDPLAGLTGQKRANAQDFLTSYHAHRKGPSGEFQIEIRFSKVPARWTVSTTSKAGGRYGKTKMTKTDVKLCLHLSPDAPLIGYQPINEHPQWMKSMIHIPLGFEPMTPPDAVESLMLITTANLYNGFHLRKVHLLRMQTGHCITTYRVNRDHVSERIEFVLKCHRKQITDHVKARMSR
jgi:hypothetical protein